MSFEIENIDLIHSVDTTFVHMPLINNLSYTNISLGGGSNVVVQNGQTAQMPLVLRNNSDITLNSNTQVTISNSGFYLLTFNFTAVTQDLSNNGDGIGLNINVNNNIENDQSQSATFRSNTTATQGQNFSSSWIIGLNSGDYFTINFHSVYSGATSENLRLTRINATLNLISGI